MTLETSTVDVLLGALCCGQGWVLASVWRLGQRLAVLEAECLVCRELRNRTLRLPDADGRPVD